MCSLIEINLQPNLMLLCYMLWYWALKLGNHSSHKRFSSSKPFCHQNVSFWQVCFWAIWREFIKMKIPVREQYQNYLNCIQRFELQNKDWMQCKRCCYGCPLFEKRKWLPVQIPHPGMYTHFVCHQVNPRVLS